MSGYEVYNPPKWLLPYLPYAVWAEKRLENIIPRTVVRWLMDGADLPQSKTDLWTLPLCRNLVNPVTEIKWPSPWPARTLVIAAGRSGIVPSADHPHDARKLAQIGQEKNRATKAVTHPDMRHPWNRQAPELFCATIIAWFEKQELPEGFIPL